MMNRELEKIAKGGFLRGMWNNPGRYRGLRRAGVVSAGVAGAGGVGHQWHRAAQNEQQLQQLQQDWEQKQEFEYMQKLLAQRPHYKIGENYLPNAPITPKAAKLPALPKPMSTTAGPPKLPGLAGTLGVGTTMTGAGRGVPATPGPETAKAAGLLNKIAFLDQGIGPLLAGGAGGIGGYLLGDKVIAPAMANRQKAIREAMAKGEGWLSRLERGKKIAPFAGAIAGALLLAAIASRISKNKERERFERMLLLGMRPEQDGFYSQDRRSVRDPAAAFYG